MNCERAGCLIDQYLDNQISRYERQRLESHLASCSSCFAEMRSRSALEQAVWQALAASVQHRTLSPEASARIVQAAQGSVRQGIRSNHAWLTVRAVATLATATLVVIGLLFLMEGIPVPTGPRPVTVLPVIQLALAELNPPSLSAKDQPISAESDPTTQPTASQFALALSNSDLRIEPVDLHPGDRFTMTIVLHSDLFQPVDTARLDLEIDSPQGNYRFPLTVKGPLPASGVSVLRVTPENLEAPCQKQYLISPMDIFATPGVYTVRVTLFSPVVTPRQ